MAPHIQENVDLQAFNTFGLSSRARYLAEVHSLAELQALLALPLARQVPLRILGGGSNILLTQDVEALVIKILLKGIEKTGEDEQYIYVKAGAGENWHGLVQYCIAQGWAGLENLSLIPGTVGAAPMQNIGAYGVEIREVFHSLEAVDRATGEVQLFDREACRFGYRESIFKQAAKDRYIIVSVTFRLFKQPRFKLSYGAIADTLATMHTGELTLAAVSQAVVHIRQSKLPDPKQIGNAGSFFKNPEIPTPQYEQLKTLHPGIPGYPGSREGHTKVAAGWLIEQCGWKGKRVGHTGAHQQQALVLVNYGEATGSEIWQLAQDIVQSVRQQFGIELQPEVNLW